MKPLVQHFGEPIALPETVQITKKTPKAESEGPQIQQIDAPLLDPVHGITGPCTVSAYASPKGTVYQFIGDSRDFRVTMPPEFNAMLYAQDAAASNYVPLMSDKLKEAGIHPDTTIIEQLYALADRVKVKPPTTQVAAVGAVAERPIPGSTAQQPWR
jgi:hypothetical protein